MTLHRVCCCVPSPTNDCPTLCENCGSNPPPPGQAFHASFTASLTMNNINCAGSSPSAPPCFPNIPFPSAQTLQLDDVGLICYWFTLSENQFIRPMVSSPNPGCRGDYYSWIAVADLTCCLTPNPAPPIYKAVWCLGVIYAVICDRCYACPVAVSGYERDRLEGEECPPHGSYLFTGSNIVRPDLIASFSPGATASLSG